MRLARLAGAAAAAFVLVPAGSAAAANQLYTSPTGSDSATCAANDPCSLHKAFTGPGPGDEIIIGTGSYTLTTALLTSVPVNVHGATGAPRPVIQTSEAIALYNAGSTASDLEIHTSVSSQNGFEVDGPSVERVVVKATPPPGAGATACVFAGAATIRDVVCWGKGTAPGETDALNTGDEHTADRTTVLRNVTAVVTGTAPGYAIYVGASSGKKHTLRVFNTIARHQADDDFFVAVGSGGTIDGHTSHTNYEKPHFFGPPADAQLSDDTPRQTAAPTFVDVANGDLHEAPGSPTIDAGLNDAANGATDADGVARIVNGTTDIGAFERTLPPSVVTGDATPAATGSPAAALSGSVIPNGLTTSFHFEYGTTTDYGQATPLGDAGPGADVVPAAANVTGLAPKALYHYRLVGENALGAAGGADKTFATPPLAFAGVAFVTTKARVKKGRVAIKLSCPDPSTLTSCTGTLRLAKSATRRRNGRKTRKTVTVGRASFAIDAGQAKTLRVKLTKAGRALAKRKLTVSAGALATDARGGTAVATSAKVKLLPPKKKQRRRAATG